MDSNDYVEFSVAEGVARLLFRTPPSEKPIRAEALRDIVRALRALDADPAVRVMVFTVAGRPLFDVGLDGVREGDLVRQLSLLDCRWKMRVAQARTPTIAAIPGAAVDAGLELALACDVRFASTASTFAFSGVERGNVPGPIALQRLPAIVGHGAAADLFFTGRHIDAQEAWRIGLVTYVCEPDHLLDRVLDYARGIAGRSRLAIQGIKSALQEHPVLSTGLESAYQSLLAYACHDQGARVDAGGPRVGGAGT